MANFSLLVKRFFAYSFYRVYTIVFFLLTLFFLMFSSFGITKGKLIKSIILSYQSNIIFSLLMFASGIPFILFLSFVVVNSIRKDFSKSMSLLFFTRPVSRVTYIFSKFFSIVIYTLVLSFLIAFTFYSMSLALFSKEISSIVLKLCISYFFTVNIVSFIFIAFAMLVAILLIDSPIKAYIIIFIFHISVFIIAVYNIFSGNINSFFVLPLKSLYALFYSFFLIFGLQVSQSMFFTANIISGRSAAILTITPSFLYAFLYLFLAFVLLAIVIAIFSKKDIA